MSKLSQGTLQRTLTQGADLNIETLEQIAKAVGLDVPHLFMPLAKPESTGELIVLEPGEKELWQQFIQLKKDFRGLQ